jgi:hypothetical protein
MSEGTCLESMYNFYNMVVAVFIIVYLREPNAEDTLKTLPRCYRSMRQGVVHG